MTTDRSVVLSVVCFLGSLAVVGLLGLLWLAHEGADASTIAVIAGPTGTALGALAGLLATTRTVDEGEVRDAGYNEALDDVRTLGEPSEP